MACKTRLRVGKTMGSAHTEKGKKREGEESWAQGRPWTGSGKGGEGGGGRRPTLGFCFPGF